MDMVSMAARAGASALELEAVIDVNESVNGPVGRRVVERFLRRLCRMKSEVSVLRRMVVLMHVFERNGEKGKGYGDGICV